MEPTITYTVIFFVSIIIGFINTLAGSGSLVMLPILMEMGLSAKIANSTNRIAVLMQSTVGVTTFLRTKKVKIGNAWWAIIPCIFGAILGAYLAMQIDSQNLKKFIGVLLIVMLGVLLLKPKRWLKTENSDGERSKGILSIIIMFIVGVYGGFIQAGVGIFLLTGLVLGIRYSLSHANAIKLIIVFLYTIPVVIIFIWNNQIDWFFGLFTALGQSIGAYIGAKFAANNPKADLWIYRLLVLVVIAAIIHFYKLWTYVMFF